VPKSGHIFHSSDDVALCGVQFAETELGELANWRCSRVFRP
jgi:hypothetical protein